MQKNSIAPDGREFVLPTKEESILEKEKINQITEQQRKLGRKIVAVQGLGFVGCVMAVVIADAEDKHGNPIYFVHGHQRASVRSYWKVPVINTGEPPVRSSSPFQSCITGCGKSTWKKTCIFPWMVHVP